MVKAAECNLRETELKVGLDEKRLKQERELQERRFLLEQERMKEESAKTQAS
jgi:hypothetical protein